MKHVALVMSLNKRFDRKVIEGVTRFVRESGNWSVFVEDDPQAKIPDFHQGRFDGVIADLDDPRIPKRLVELEIPAVGVGAIREDCPWELDISTVSTNNQRIAVLAASHLLERNLRSFAYSLADAEHCPRRRTVEFHLTLGNLARSAQHSVHRFRRSWLG